METCGTCWYWKGGPVLHKRKCLCPLIEGQTFVNFAGITAPSDSCSRWRKDAPNKKIKTD